MAQPNKNADGGNYRMSKPSMSGFGEERMVAIVVLVALGLLILIRMGFRGVNVLGVSASVN